MNLEKLFKLIYDNPYNVEINYQYVDGKEKLTVNGKDVEDFDDSEVLDNIADYKKLLERLNDCEFMDIAKSMEESINLVEFDKLVNKKAFNEKEAHIVNSMIDKAKAIIYNYLVHKVGEINEILISI